MPPALAHLRAIGLLPFPVLVLIPGALLAWSRGAWALAPAGGPRFGVALLGFGLGLSLMAGTIRRFQREGDGTLAPWDPTQKLVVTGIYRRVRNPMITGVVTNLAAEALLFGSWAVGLWAILFFLGNALYIPLSEEPGLERRFGEAYRRYKENVPRWIPRIRPWRPDPA